MYSLKILFLKLTRIESEREALAKIVENIGSKAARREFDEKYNLTVHNIIWNDLSPVEKFKHKIKVQKRKLFSLVRHSFPPSFVNKYDQTQVLIERQTLTWSTKWNTKNFRNIRSVKILKNLYIIHMEVLNWEIQVVFLIFTKKLRLQICVIFCFAMTAIVGMDDIKYDGTCYKKACFYYGDHTSMYTSYMKSNS